MLSKKSPQTSCRIRIRNDRFRANGFLNQRCALAPDLESILRARMSKIVFRQHRPNPDIGRGIAKRPIAYGRSLHRATTRWRNGTATFQVSHDRLCDAAREQSPYRVGAREHRTVSWH